MEWIKLEDQLPPKNTMVLVKRYPNKIEEQPIYLAMRQDKELSKNPDASRDCFWHGNHIDKFFSEQENYYQLDGLSRFSDVTVKEWAFVSFNI